jgi:hypothetical protein
MLGGQKALEGITSKPYEYMYDYVSDALKYGVPTHLIVDSIIIGLKGKRDTFMRRSIYLKILLADKSHGNIPFEDAERLYKDKLARAYEEAKRKDYYWRKAIESDEARQMLEKMRMNPNLLFDLSIEERSELIAEAVRNGSESAIRRIEEKSSKSVAYEGVIITCHRDGNLNIDLVTPEKYKQVRQTEIKARKEGTIVNTF